MWLGFTSFDIYSGLHGVSSRRGCAGGDWRGITATQAAVDSWLSLCQPLDITNMTTFEFHQPRKAGSAKNLARCVVCEALTRLHGRSGAIQLLIAHALAAALDYPWMGYWHSFWHGGGNRRASLLDADGGAVDC
jgi:hypothetical protein